MGQETIFDSILAHIRNSPGKEALHYFRDKKPGMVTYGEFGMRIAAVATWLKSRGIVWRYWPRTRWSGPSLIWPCHLSPEVKRLIRAKIETLNEELARFEQVKDFAILDRDFSVEDDLLTPTLKLKRKNIIARYGSIIEAIYADEVKVW
ncbi:MAG: hypothetical protein JXA20_13545 [Spirochaetes bacterium]|nr:hypothetical protein [Spirochaetota bacterium]